jgi:phosphatidylglycerol:prolipoprotein diacylglycerol transferase
MMAGLLVNYFHTAFSSLRIGGNCASGDFQDWCVRIALLWLHARSVLFVRIWLATRRAKNRGINPNDIMDLSVIILISSIVGSRLMYVVFHLDEFRGRWLDTINPFQSDGQIGLAGLTLLGGVLLAFISSYLFLRHRKLSFLKFADVVMPSVGLGIFLTRIGCFLNGCCFGLPCEHGHGWCVLFLITARRRCIPRHSPDSCTAIFIALWSDNFVCFAGV